MWGPSELGALSDCTGGKLIKVALPPVPGQTCECLERTEDLYSGSDLGQRWVHSFVPNPVTPSGSRQRFCASSRTRTTSPQISSLRQADVLRLGRGRLQRDCPSTCPHPCANLGERTGGETQLSTIKTVHVYRLLVPSQVPC